MIHLSAWGTLALAGILNVAYLVWYVWRDRRRQARDDYIEDCRKVDAILRPQGFVPTAFSENEARWDSSDGRHAIVSRRRTR